MKILLPLKLRDKLLKIAETTGVTLDRIDDTIGADNENLVWLASPKFLLKLTSIRNSLGIYVYRDEILRMKSLLGIPIGKGKAREHLALVHVTREMLISAARSAKIDHYGLPKRQKPDFDPAVDGAEFEKIQKEIAALDYGLPKRRRQDVRMKMRRQH